VLSRAEQSIEPFDLVSGQLLAGIRQAAEVAGANPGPASRKFSGQHGGQHGRKAGELGLVGQFTRG